MKRVVLACVLVFLCSGCATPVYKDMFKETVNYNCRDFAVSQGGLQFALVRALCAKGFIIDKEEKERGFILAKRPFQQGRKTTILLLQAQMVASGSQDKTTLYLNALQTTERSYVADHTRFFLWLIPLPGGGGKDACTVKEGENVISDKKFYEDFFSLIEKEINVAPAAPAEEKPVAS